jgi:hypothetical protein
MPVSIASKTKFGEFEMLRRNLNAKVSQKNNPSEISLWSYACPIKYVSQTKFEVTLIG